MEDLTIPEKLATHITFFRFLECVHNVASTRTRCCWLCVIAEINQCINDIVCKPTDDIMGHNLQPEVKIFKISTLELSKGLPGRQDNADP